MALATTAVVFQMQYPVTHDDWPHASLGVKPAQIEGGNVAACATENC